MHASPRRLFRRRALGLGVLLVSALVASGCASAVEQQSAGGASEKPVEGGTVNIVQAADISPSTIMSQNNPNMSMNRLVFNTLIEYNHETLEPEPSLAKSWELTNDGATVTFALREGVTFHDGRAFTADDVIQSLATVQREDVPSQLKHDAKLITEMVAVDPQTVSVTFGHAVSNVFDLFAMTSIIDVNTVDDLLAGKAFNGTGPFVVDSYSPGQGLKLSKNTDYWVKGLPHLDGVNITVVRDSQSMLSSLKAGQSQLALDMAPLDASSVKDDPAFKLVEADAHDSTYYVASNVTVPLLSDKKVRQAISYAIDRDRILDQVLGGIGSTTSLPWSPASPAYDEDLNDHYARDLDKAKKLLEEAGAVGQKVSLYYNSGFGPNAAIAEIVQFDLKELGLDVTVEPQQAAEFQTNLTSGGLNGLFINGHGFGQLNPATLLKGAFPFNADKNASSFDNQTYKDLANAVWKETDDSKIPALLEDVNEFFLEEQFVSDLVTSSHTYVITNKLAGLKWTMLDAIDLEEAYLG